MLPIHISGELLVLEFRRWGLHAPRVEGHRKGIARDPLCLLGFLIRFVFKGRRDTLELGGVSLEDTLRLVQTLKGREGGKVYLGAIRDFHLVGVCLIGRGFVSCMEGR